MPIRKAKKVDPDVILDSEAVAKIADAATAENLASWTQAFVNDIASDVKAAESSIMQWQKQILDAQVRMGRNHLLLSLSTTALNDHLSKMLAQIKTVPGVHNIVVGRTAIAFCTEVIWVQNTLVNPITQHFLGSYRVRVHHSGLIEFCSMHKMPAKLDEQPHPHVDGNVCLGGYKTMIGAAYSSFDYYNLVLVIMEYLRSVTLTDYRGSSSIGDFPTKEMPLLTDAQLKEARYFPMFTDSAKRERYGKKKPVRISRRGYDDDDDEDDEEI